MQMKTIIALIGAFPLTIGVSVLKYVYQDWEFAKWIAMAVLIDTAVSMVKHWILQDLSSEDFWHKFAKKVFAYICLLILSNLLANAAVNGHTIGSMEHISEYICWAMLLRESFSIVENSNAIIPWCPKWLLRRLKDYNENGEYVKKNKIPHDPEQNMED